MSLPSTQTRLLVVEGFINTSGITEIRLSRTTNVAERITAFEKEAIVRIETEDNIIYPLAEQDSGKYLSDNLQLDLTKKYRINILTGDNKRYVSSFEAPVITPPIDSISWIRYNRGVEIYVNAHDNINNTKYFRWEYDETWEFTSKYRAVMDLVLETGSRGQLTARARWRDSVNFIYVDSLYRCWQSRKSSAIKLGSTEQLGESRVYSPIIFFPYMSSELGVMYSVLVRQYGLNKEAYKFYSKIKKNTESLGSIFDAMPSELKGNIVNSDDEKELVVGYVGVSSVTERRVFIANSSLDGWLYEQPCELQISSELFSDSLLQKVYYSNRLATLPIIKDGALIGVMAANKFCVDCRLRGSNVKPSFWP